MWGSPEHVISEPLGPKAIVKIIYDNCLPYDPIEAVLQQEVGGREEDGEIRIYPRVWATLEPWFELWDVGSFFFFFFTIFINKHVLRWIYWKLYS